MFRIIICVLGTFLNIVLYGDNGEHLKYSTQTDSLKVEELVALTKSNLQVNVANSYAYCDSAILLSKKIGNDYSLALSYKTFGIVYYFDGFYDSALTCYKKSLELYYLVSDKEGVASVYHNISVVYLESGMYTEAIEPALSALKIFEEKKDTAAIARSYSTLGNIFGEMNDIQKAIDYHTKAVDFNRKLERQVGIANALNNLGSDYSSAKQYHKAIECHLEALALRQVLGDKLGIATSLINLGNNYTSLNNDIKAISYYNQALELVLSLGNKRMQASVLSNISLHYINTNQFQKAEKALRSAEVLAKETQALPILRDVYRNYSNLMLRSKNTSKAYYYYVDYVTLKDSIFNIDKHNQIQNLERRYETQKKEQAIAMLTEQDEINKELIRVQQNEIKIRKLLGYLSIFLFVAVVAIGFLIFNRYKLTQRNLKNQLTMEKVQLEQRFLRQQMNPHFIFNSLNSIQYFISENNSHEAVNYLSKFANLMRLTLENTMQNFVPFQSDLDSLKLYLDLEMLRFNNNFSYTLKIDDGIEPEFIGIPPMLIQPYLENAIIHGLSPKGVGGEIKIEYQFEGNAIKCIVEDNGVGRKASMNERKEMPFKRKSLGMQITHDRLAILKRQMNADVSEVIIDLHDDEGCSAGTRVELLIPIVNL